MARLTGLLLPINKWLTDSLFYVMWRQKLIQAAYASASILVSGIVLWLLVETNLGCDYVYFFQLVLLPSLIGSELFWQFLSARITDTSPRHAKTILLVTSIAQIVLDCVAFFFAKTSRWFVFVWFILRFAAQQQVGNSTGKILKMRIEWVLQVPQEMQLNYFNAVVVMGELLGRSTAVLFVYLLGAYFGHHGYSFYTIRNVFFIVLAMWDIVCLTCTVLLPMSYFLPESRLSVYSAASTNSAEDDIPLMDHIDASDDTSAGLAGATAVSEYFVAQDELNKAYERELELGEAPNGANPLIVFKDYFVGSAKRFWANGQLFFSCIHLWTAFMLVSFVNIVLKFEVSDVGKGSAPTRANLCAGQLVNVLQVGISENTATLVGVLVYHFGMSKVKPYFFYNKLFVGMAGAFCALFIAIFWKNSLGSYGGSLVLGALYVGLYLVQTYDGNVAASWSDPTIIAFVFAMQASFAQVLALVPILFAAFRFNNTVVLMFCIICSSAMGFSSLWYSKRNKQQILLRSEPEVVNHDELTFSTPFIFSEEESTLHGDNNEAPLQEFLSPEDLED